MLHHDLHQLLKAGLCGIPAQLGLGLGGIAPKVDDVGGTIEVFANSHNRLANELLGAFHHNTPLIKTFSFELEFNAGIPEGQLGELADGVLYTGSNHEVLRRVVLQDEPHALHIVLGIAPVAEAVHIAQVEAVLQALADAGGGKGDLAGDEGLATALALVVEEDAAAAEHIVGLAVLLDNPEAVELGHGIGAVGMEGGVLVLRNFLHLAIELGGAGLIDAAGLLQVAGTHGLEHTEHTGGIDIGRELGRVKADLHVALGGEIVDLVRFNLVNNFYYRHGVAQVCVMQVKVRLAFQVRNALAEVNTATADDTMHFVAFLQ